jgi:uncharacterized Zn-finger protein
MSKEEQNDLMNNTQLKRTHKCHKCFKEYNKTSHLRAHLRAHDNYRPYICDYINCNKSFTRSDELKRHKRIHTDERSFHCTICPKTFLRSDHLTKHLLVHSRENNPPAQSILPPPLTGIKNEKSQNEVEKYSVNQTEMNHQ